MYIDPGSGSMFLQGLIASALGSLVAFRRAIASLFSRLRSGSRSSKDGKA